MPCVSVLEAREARRMLCEGSLATKKVGMLLKEMVKPQKDFKARTETIKELQDKEEPRTDEEATIGGEEDILLVDNKAATQVAAGEQDT